MKASVFDTYVEKKEGGVMHFDILVRQDTAVDDVLRFGHEYLDRKGQTGQALTTHECRFCHVEQATEPVERAILENGYFILEMQNCN